jgi:hypothetical protein
MGIATPVAFLVFNRPDTTEQVFAAIRQAQPETLLLVADGPRAGRPDEVGLCAKVRSIIEQIDWPCRVLKKYSDVNMGCKGRVSSGLDWVFSEVEEAIILEDDCLPHPDFFPFCQEMLDRYRNNERIMMIGGTNYLVDRLQIPESYLFSRYFPVWGWASWRRAWENYDITMQQWSRFRKEGQLRGYYAERYMRRFLTSTFDNASSGRINTWDSQWFFACLSNNGLSIIPSRNMISNIGTVGAHAGGYSANNFFKTFPCEVNNLIHPVFVTPNQLYDQQFFNEQFKVHPTSIARSLKAFIRKRARRIWPGNDR